MWRWARRREQWSWEKISTPVHACSCMLLRVFCVRMCPFSRVIKDPIHRTHQVPLNPCSGIKQCCHYKRALFSRPPTPPLSSFVFHFFLQGNLCLFLLLSFLYYFSLCTSTFIFCLFLCTSLFSFNNGDYQKSPMLCLICENVWDSKAELSKYWTAHYSVLWFAHRRGTFLLWFWLLLSGPANCSSCLRHGSLFNRPWLYLLAFQQQPFGFMSNWCGLFLAGLVHIVFANT